jgi:hypothetical protein
VRGSSGRPDNRGRTGPETAACVTKLIELRCAGFPGHTYPGRDEDLATIHAYIAGHGIPPSGFFARLLWRLRGEGGASGQMHGNYAGRWALQGGSYRRLRPVLLAPPRPRAGPAPVRP